MEGGGLDTPGMSPPRCLAAPVRRPPEVDGPIGPRAGQVGAIRAQAEVVQQLVAANRGGGKAAGLQVPDLQLGPSGGDEAVVDGERPLAEHTAVGLEDVDELCRA